MTFKRDTEETPVIFRRSRRKEPEGLAAEVTAVFPCEPATTSDDGLMTCYAHIGQHGQCSQGWYIGTKRAKPDEYRALKAELEAAPYGYRLKVYSRMQPWMREARREALRKMKGEWTVADTTDTYLDGGGHMRYRVKARFTSEQAAVEWLTTQDQTKVARGDFEICGPAEE